jgi:hypothetical protein
VACGLLDSAFCMIRSSKNLNLWVTLLAIVCIIGTLSRVSAVSLAINDSRDLGLIDPNHPANPTDSASFIDILLSQPLGSGPTTVGANAYTRTSNDPLNGVYPAASYSGVEFGSNVTNIGLGSSGYRYLLAKYDGPNFGSVVWYIGGLLGDITIPQYGSDQQYAVSHTYLYNPNGTSSVPDGGATVIMLGFSICALGVGLRLIRPAAPCR